MDGLNISNNIARLRRGKKITQEQLAEFIGVTKASVSKWENGQSTPDITILPRLAAFFDVTVDGLIGYTPQLSKEQIQKLYQDFGKAFAGRPFEDVMNETQDYVKRYYSCYPFLLQMCILWLNHCKMADTEERRKDVCLRIEKLCQHIKENCRNMSIHGNAVLIQSFVRFQAGDIQEAVPELEELSESGRFGSQSLILLAQAHTMLGNTEKADGYAQFSMYDSIMTLLSGATCYLAMHAGDLSVCQETIGRIGRVAEAYQLEGLHPNIVAGFEYQAAVCYLAHGENQKALGHIDRYVQCLSRLFSTEDLCLHGDAYFNRVEEWLGNELDSGTNAPRNRRVVLEDAKTSLDAPPFAALNGNPEFERIKRKLKELS